MNQCKLSIMIHGLFLSIQFNDKCNVKKLSIQYPVMRFELRMSRWWVSSINHLSMVQTVQKPK